MWVTKLLISPVKKRIFCPKTTKFGPKLAFLVNLDQAMQAYSVPCWLVGWWLWRAGCISQDTYLLYGILIFLATIQDHSRTPQNMFYYWLGVLIAYIIELNKFLRGTKRKICFAHYRCISRQNYGGNFLCGKKGQKGGGGVSEGVSFFRRNPISLFHKHKQKRYGLVLMYLD